VPHHLPGTNDDVNWFSRRYKIPMNVITSGAASMYPEIRSQIPKSLGGFAPEPPPGPAPACAPAGGTEMMRAWTALYVLLVSAGAAAQDVKPSPLVKAPMVQPPPAGQIEVLPIRGNLYALMGAGNNVVISVGGDGVFVVDAAARR
jgi:hypothetical protein